jgi:hypothetical protein
VQHVRSLEKSQRIMPSPTTSAEIQILSNQLRAAEEKADSLIENLQQQLNII